MASTGEKAALVTILTALTAGEIYLLWQSLQAKGPAQISTNTSVLTPVAMATRPAERDFSNRWPKTAEDFLKAIQVSEDQIPAEYLADPYYRSLQPGMVTKEFGRNGEWTGGWQLFLERDAGNKDRFPFVVIKNPGPMMQYGLLHDPNLRKRAGFTAEEVRLLGIGQNHIGSGIPVTDIPIAVEGLTFYPRQNEIDGSNNLHSLLKLGQDMQTLEARLTRSKQQSSIRQPGYRLPNRITSITQLTKTEQEYQQNPFKGII